MEPQIKGTAPSDKGVEIRAEINRRHWEGGATNKQAMLQTLDALDAWSIAIEHVEHEGVMLAAIPEAVLPVTNMCNYCHFKGSACWERENPLLCYNDSRPDGISVIFAILPTHPPVNPQNPA